MSGVNGGPLEIQNRDGCESHWKIWVLFFQHATVLANLSETNFQKNPKKTYDSYTFMNESFRPLFEETKTN